MHSIVKCFFRSFICVLSFILCNYQAKAQDPVVDFKNINNVYRGLTKMAMDIDYRLYTSAASTTPYETQKGKIKVNGLEKYQKISNIEMLINKKYQLIVDHDNSLLMMSYKKPNQTLDLLSKISIDTLMRLYKDVTAVKCAASQRAFRLQYKDQDSECEWIEVYYNSSTFLVEKIRMQYRETIENAAFKSKPVLEIRYNNIVINPEFGAQEFSERQFVLLKEGKYNPTGIYKKFRFINHIN